jgi:hypothetical protein
MILIKINFSGNVPWPMIISIASILPIVGFIAMMYFCRCYQWGHATTDMFKDVDKEVDHDSYKGPLPVSKPGVQIMNGGHVRNNSGNSDPKTGTDWTEMQDMPSPQSGKKSGYQRAGSKVGWANIHHIFFNLNNEYF